MFSSDEREGLRVFLSRIFCLGYLLEDGAGRFWDRRKGSCAFVFHKYMLCSIFNNSLKKMNCIIRCFMTGEDSLELHMVVREKVS